MSQFVTNAEGKRFKRIATRTTTSVKDDAGKNVEVERGFVEVLVLDGRIVSAGSQWGHVAIEIDGIVYSRVLERYETGSYREYLIAQTQASGVDIDGRSRGKNRDGIGFLLWVTPEEKSSMRTELERRVKAGQKYNLLTNSCSTNVSEVLSIAGIVSKDPRYFDLPVSPKEMLKMLGRSPRLVEKRNYIKGWSGGASGNW